MIIPEELKKELTEDLRQAIEELAQHNFNGELENKIYKSTKKLIEAYNEQKKVELYFDDVNSENPTSLVWDSKSSNSIDYTN